VTVGWWHSWRKQYVGTSGGLLHFAFVSNSEPICVFAHFAMALSPSQLLSALSQVHASVGRPSGCPTAANPLLQLAGSLMRAWPAGDIDRLLHGAHLCTVL